MYVVCCRSGNVQYILQVHVVHVHETMNNACMSTNSGLVRNFTLCSDYTAGDPAVPYRVNMSCTMTITGKFFPFASCQQLTSYVAFLAEHVHSRQPPCIVIVYAICLLWPRNCCLTTVADRALNRRNPRWQPPDINRTVRFSIRHDTVAISRCTPTGCPRVWCPKPSSLTRSRRALSSMTSPSRRHEVAA